MKPPTVPYLLRNIPRNIWVDFEARLEREAIPTPKRIKLLQLIQDYTDAEEVTHD